MRERREEKTSFLFQQTKFSKPNFENNFESVLIPVQKHTAHIKINTPACMQKHVPNLMKDFNFAKIIIA